MTTRTLVDALEANVNTLVLDAEAAVVCVIASILARSHVFVWGEPGVGKTFLMNTLVGSIGDLGDGYFDYEMGALDGPEGLVGMPSLRALTVDDAFVRQAGGLLPFARLATIRELFLGGPGTLRYLNSILNERQFFDGRTRHQSPLSTLVCDSNAIPHRSVPLAPVWDRLTLRVECSPSTDPDVFDAMTEAALRRRNTHGATTSTSLPIVSPVIGWGQIAEAQREVAAVTFSAEARDGWRSIWVALGEKGLRPSPRRWNEVLGPIQATAWRRGSKVAGVEDFDVAAHGLWVHPDDRDEIAGAVWRVSNPVEADILDYTREVNEFAKTITEMQTKGLDRAQRISAAAPLQDRMEELAREQDRLSAASARSSRPSTSIGAFTRRLEEVSMMVVDATRPERRSA